MVSSSQIKFVLAMFLDGNIDLDSFEDWFVFNTWNIHLSGSVDAETLTFAVEESLSEYSSGHISLSQLRHELNEFVHRQNKLFVYRDQLIAPAISWSGSYRARLAFAQL